MKKYLVALLTVSWITALGCGSGTGLEGLVSVQGTVTYNGNPVEGATVTFSPVAAGSKAAVGKTDASGVYSLTTRDPGDGIMPGDYTISVSKTEATGGLSLEEAEKWTEENPGKQPPSPKITEHLPAKYKTAKTSGLKATVAESDDNVFDFVLED